MLDLIRLAEGEEGIEGLLRRAESSPEFAHPEILVRTPDYLAWRDMRTDDIYGIRRIPHGVVYSSRQSAGSGRIIEQIFSIQID